MYLKLRTFYQGNQIAINSFFSDSFWTMFSQSFVVFINLFSVYILANILSQNNFGEFKLITTWLGIAAGIGYTGYYYILPQKIARGESYNLNKVFLETFVKSLPTFIGLFFLSAYYLYNHNLNLSSGFFFASLVAPTLCVSTLVNIYYMGKSNFKMFALAQNFVDTIQLLVLSLLAYYTSNFILIISIYYLATIFANLLIIAKVLHDDRKIKQVNRPIVEIPSLPIPERKMQSKLNISGIILGFTNQIDKLLIFHFIGAAPLAIYSITSAMSDQARTPIKALSSAIFPRMTKDRFTKKKLFITYFILTLLCIFLFLILLVLYPYIFKYLFPKYIEYIYLANIASLSILFAPTQLLYLYSQSKNDLQTLNTYANLNTFLQITLYTLATFLGSIVLFLIFKTLIMFSSTVYQIFRIIKS